MVHPGKPSRGCDVCRKRRIKCDERVPSCSYCLKKQVKCPGYKSQFDVAWRDQNLVAEQSVRRRKKANEKAAATQSGVINQAVKQQSPTLLKTLSEDFENYAINFFMSSYILLPKDDDVERGLLDSLYPVWIEAEATSPLRPIVAAVASCMLEAWSQLIPDSGLSLSRLRYMAGVAALRKSLQNGKDATDDIIMASLMLHMYEQLRSFMAAERNISPHISGITALVESRKRLPVVGETSQKLLVAARSHIIDRALRDSERVPTSISTIGDLANAVPRTPGLELDNIDIQIADLQDLVSRLDTTSAFQSSTVFELLRKATEIDCRLIDWSENLPSDWAPIPVSGIECIAKEIRAAGTYNEYCTVYKNIFVANTHNEYTSSRIKVQQLILGCLKHLNATKISTASAMAQSIIQEMADSICDAIPFHLGDRMAIGRAGDRSAQYPHVAGVPVSSDHYLAAASFGGFYLAGRLAHLLSPAMRLRDGQRQWIGGQLRRVRDIYSTRPV